MNPSIHPRIHVRRVNVDAVDPGRASDAPRSRERPRGSAECAAYKTNGMDELRGKA